MAKDTFRNEIGDFCPFWGHEFFGGSVTLKYFDTYQHVHKNDRHSQHKQKEQYVRQHSVFQFVPRHKCVGVVELTKCHHKYGHHRIWEGSVRLLTGK